ncbi:MAG: hypothetical protein MRJ93_12585 [Nitrososphaeraceae archaeon]|nr:hypothetical protein [Nitrososphaeraceae archaeon]
MIPYEFIYSFTKSILLIDDAIRWVGITDKQGTLINERYREGVVLLLNEEENEEYASNAISRQRSRVKFEPKIGKLIYAFGKYENVSRVTIPISENYYLLLTLDSMEKKVDEIIMSKVIPIINQTKEKFTT